MLWLCYVMFNTCMTIASLSQSVDNCFHANVIYWMFQNKACIRFQLQIRLPTTVQPTRVSHVMVSTSTVAALVFRLSPCVSLPVLFVSTTTLLYESWIVYFHSVAYSTPTGVIFLYELLYCSQNTTLTYTTCTTKTSPSHQRQSHWRAEDQALGLITTSITWYEHH
jgi:hypothetical protein